MENKAGAGGLIGADGVSKSAPDGYTLVMGTVSSHAIAPAVYRKMPYDAVADFGAVSLVALTPYIITVNPSVPASSLRELVAHAKANPDKLNFGSSGTGTTPHLAGELFNTLAGTRVNTPVKDVGAQISIFTKDFIKDVGATNLEELMGYAVGTQRDLTEESATAGVFNSNTLKTSVASFRVRGITGVGRARNYFVWPGAEIDFATTDRVDFSRGPNSILFGLGSPAGIFNLATKQADLNRSFANFEVRTSNFLQRRASADINAASRDKRLAVRFVPLFDHAPTWREHEYRERNGLYGAVTFAATRKTTIRADFEKARIDQTLLGRPWTALDVTSYWEDAGKPIMAASAYTVATNPTTGITSATPKTLAVTTQSGIMGEARRAGVPDNTYAFVFNPATGYAANWAPMPIGYGTYYTSGPSAYVRTANNLISSDPKYVLYLPP